MRRLLPCQLAIAAPFRRAGAYPRLRTTNRGIHRLASGLPHRTSTLPSVQSTRGLRYRSRIANPEIQTQSASGQPDRLFPCVGGPLADGTFISHSQIGKIARILTVTYPTTIQNLPRLHAHIEPGVHRKMPKPHANQSIRPVAARKSIHAAETIKIIVRTQQVIENNGSLS